ncbi:MAG: T9SS type A sorting domain-containing protein [Saprospiraceae bacterium]|nr:T9SS type A sorting domain-containing protein [Saprospiraceae bacterium]
MRVQVNLAILDPMTRKMNVADLRLIVTLGLLILQTPFIFVAAQRICLSRPGVTDPEQYSRQLDDDSLIVIPVVVHLIYRDSSQLVAEEDIQWQIEQTTLDYRRLNTDRDLTPPIFSNVAADTKIAFCLANLDPQGLPTPGITMTQTTLDEIGYSDAYYQSFLGGQDSWDPAAYLNIWVCEISSAGDVSGFATYPDEGLNEKDGVVIDYRYFGRGAQSVAPFNNGRTLTHEAGHWLGLEHIWGTEPGCDTDDGIPDTPLQLDRYRNCPGFPQVSCGTQDMFMNFMDLTDDGCMNLFTQGQKGRMRNTLFSQRASIRFSSGCNSEVTGTNVQETSGIRIYPNPVKDYLELKYESNLEGLHLEVRHISGKKIDLEVNAGSKIDVSELTPGIYILIARHRKNLYCFKFIKT